MSGPGPAPPAHWPRFTILLTILVIGTVYVATLVPGIGGTGDNAKFTYLAYVLGIGHPTGYPVYLLMLKGWISILPFTSIPLSAHAFSAACALAACAITLQTLLREGFPALAAVVAVASLAWSKSFWRNAVHAEVYSLAALFLVTCLALILANERSQSRIRLHFAIVFFGISLGNHMLSLVLMPALLAAAISSDPGAWTRVRTWMVVIVSVALGASTYVLLLMRSADATTLFVEHSIPDLAALVEFVSGRKYESAMFAFSWGEVLTQRVPKVLEIFVNEWSVALPLAIWGFSRLRRPLRYFAITTLAIDVFVMINYGIPDIVDYVLPASLALCFGLAGALADLMTRRHAIRTAARVLVILPVAFMIFNRKPSGGHDDGYGGEWSAGVLRVVDGHAAHVETPRAVVIGHSYSQGQFLFAQVFAGEFRDRGIVILRTDDIAAIAQYMHDQAPLWLGNSRTELKEPRPVYFTDPEVAHELESMNLTVKRIANGVFHVGGD